MDSVWEPRFSGDDFNQRMENAFRRASGQIGFELSRDRGNTRALRERATAALDSGLDAGRRVPLFIRMGKGALDITGYKPSGTIDLKGCAGEILREFYEEGRAAYHAAAAALHAEAREYLRDRGCSDAECTAVLSSAESSFASPDKDAFSDAARDLCQETFSPATLAILAGAVVFVPVVVVMRSPVIGVLLGLCATGVAYYLIRGKRRTRVETLAHVLPRRLYDLLQGGLNANVRRYAEVVNAAMAAKRTQKSA